ncbi:MAG: baseplate J/gp47 family protein, partial [Erysipelotrichaceae bacterium]|nr:baseplate J/gp47 family protein [Erysipelotrichaceae bacterium]
GESYRRYELTTGKGVQGRYCLFSKNEDGKINLTFDKKSFGFEPARVKDSVRVILYSEEVMRQYHVGRVLGCDDQEIQLPFSHIVPESFVLIAKRITDEGEEFFDFVRPGKTDAQALTYRLLETDGKIVIDDAGAFIGAELYLGSIAITEGPKGNIRAGNMFVAPEIDPDPIFYNPSPGTGGSFRESLADVRKRFREDVYTTYTCVTEEDYEKAAAATPGLCIKKIKAVMDDIDNLVMISVLPGTDEKFPRLSKQYIEAISNTLYERRLITTRFQILRPIYVGVSVRMTVYVKRQFLDSKDQIEEKVKSLLNYLDSDKSFGEPLIYEEVFSEIEKLECVDYVYELFMMPDNLKHAMLHIEFNGLRICNDRSLYIRCITLAKRIMVSSDKVVLHRVEVPTSLVSSRAKYYECQQESTRMIVDQLYRDQISETVIRKVLDFELISYLFWYRKLQNDPEYADKVQRITKEVVDEYLPRYPHLEGVCSRIMNALEGKEGTIPVTYRDYFHEASEHPLMSFLVRVRNHEDVLNRTLDSLTRQTVKDWELLVIAEGTQDSSLKIVRQYASIDKRITIVRRVNPEELNGEYVSLIEAGDILFYDTLEKDEVRTTDGIVRRKIARKNFRSVEAFDEVKQKKGFFERLFGRRLHE